MPYNLVSSHCRTPNHRRRFLSVPLTHVVKTHDTTRIRLRRRQGEGCIHAFGQQSLAASQRYRVEEQVQLVDHVVREKGVDKLAAAVRQDVLPWLCLEGT